MGKKEQTDGVSKQTLYIAVLVAVTLGFMAGAAYTSFKLARDGAGQPAGAANKPHPEGDAAALAQTGDEILKLETFLKENPDNAEAWVRLGNIFFDTHRFADAIEAYEKSLALAPGNPNVLTDLGVMHRRNKNPQAAVKAFDKAISARPDFETAYFNKGIVLMHDLNDLPGAISAWEDLVKINPMAQAPNGQQIRAMIQGLKAKGQ